MKKEDRKKEEKKMIKGLMLFVFVLLVVCSFWFSHSTIPELKTSPLATTPEEVIPSEEKPSEAPQEGPTGVEPDVPMDFIPFKKAKVVFETLEGEKKEIAIRGWWKKSQMAIKENPELGNSLVLNEKKRWEE